MGNDIGKSTPASTKGVTLYSMPMSPTGRAVHMGIIAAGLDIEYKSIDMMKGEHMKEEFMAMNPLHKIPLLDDNGFYLNESRSISRYIMNKFAEDDLLYPVDPKKRALVDKMLDFDMGTVYEAQHKWALPQVFARQPPNDELEKELQTALDNLNTHFLANQQYVAGDHLTIADFHLLSTLTWMELVDYDFSTWENVEAWMKRCKGEDFWKKTYEPFSVGMKMLKGGPGKPEEH